MAKRTPKETSTPLIFALVFFVLTTIAFGVMWYMQYSDQQAKDEAVKKSGEKVSAATAETKKFQLLTRLYRVYLGVEEADDRDVLKAEHKAGDELSTEMKRINEKMVKTFGGDPAKVPPELPIWAVDEKSKLADAPEKGVVTVIADAVSQRENAIKTDKGNGEVYGEAATKFSEASKNLKKEADNYVREAAALPKTFDTAIKAEIKKFTDRTKAYVDAEAASRNEIATTLEANAKLERQAKRDVQQIQDLQDQVQTFARNAAKANVQTFQYDEPQGKILRRPEPSVVEINIGSNALLKPGLTFTVLPYDFPERGRQSRMRVMRIPDEKGTYKNVERFVEKAKLEVIEVLGPNLSRARVTEEFDPIRDGAAPGDLLYNSAWRKGSADHIALMGIFDVNGDGTDDIASVVRDLTRMGIPVDAYFDMKERKWVGQITEQTRFVVNGYYPNNSATDPNRDDKTKLLGAMGDAMKVVRDKGVAEVNFRDFFPRMGYRMKIDLPLDKLNQATAPYLNRVSAVENPPMP